jgi:hypothetical protein
MKVVLCLMFFLYTPLSKTETPTHLSLPEVEVVSSSIKYKGYGSRTAKLFYEESGCKIITAICLAEHGGILPVNGNVGNIRYTKQYESYPDWKIGMKELKKVLKKRRYAKCFQKKPQDCITCIQQSGYSPESEWVLRVNHWYNLIK